MRVLWIRRGASGADAGDSIYDEKLQRALADRFAITNCLLTRNRRQSQLVHAGLSLNLPEQFGSGTPEDEVRVRALLQAHDVAIFSHEHLDRFARAMRPHTAIPFVTLRHNVTSDLMASVLCGRAPLAGAYRTMAAQQERAALRGPLYQAITAISARDAKLLTALSGRAIALVMPGAPPASPLSADADVRRELVLTGTYDWFPKARDIRRFAEEYAAAPAPDTQIHVGPGIPEPVCAALGGGADEQSLDYGAAIRFGVMTDRFTAGHKLKTAAYLMNNCAVISFSRVSDDYAAFPFARRWIFEIQHAAEIGPVIGEIVSRPAEQARMELGALKRAIGAALDWNVQAETLAGAIEGAVLKRDATLSAYAG